MKSYYKKTKMKDGIPLKCFTQRFIQDLENMDIISSYTEDVEPSGEYKNSPHVLIEISTDHFNKLKSISNDVNEKYIEMGGDNHNGWTDVSSLVQDLFEIGFEYEDIREKQYEMIEESVKEEQERNDK